MVQLFKLLEIWSKSLKSNFKPKCSHSVKPDLSYRSKPKLVWLILAMQTLMRGAIMTHSISDGFDDSLH